MNFLGKISLNNIFKYIAIILALLVVANFADALAQVEQTKGTFKDKFRQLDEITPTPNIYRNAAGEPGFAYWQQRADYKINVELDEQKRTILASEKIKYYNNSPDTLRYLWIHLDQNRFKNDSISETATDFGGIGGRGFTSPKPSREDGAKLSFDQLRRQHFMADNELGFQIFDVRDASGKKLKHTIVGTLMRIDLPEVLLPASFFEFSIDFGFNIVDENIVSARSGYENFPDDGPKNGNDIFLLAQWFPRMVAYSDYEGWHNKEFIGRGEFTLEFGNYDVEITVPSDHIVSATGELVNKGEVLNKKQIERLKKAENAKEPVYIVTPDEALENEKKWEKGKKTWKFTAKDVRDFAFASSRKFIWDAQGHKQENAEQELVMAMSFFPKEGDPLWSKYSTASVIHTLEVYSKYTFDYPYPTAQSVNGPVGGMEYPMITFNGPRTDLRENGKRTYSRAEKRFLIGVVIHEIGHFYFPMIVNSDERQWTWMDEGLNTFLQSVAEQEWDDEYPSRRGDPYLISNYMMSENQVPIMTNSESILQFGNNAYGKPASALFVLRETIMGRELFDFAFKEFSRRWKFKRPTPSDFFRTMEEASGVDLDWFFRGWFYTTDHVDISIDEVMHLRINSQDPETEKKWEKEQFEKQPEMRSDYHNRIDKNIKLKLDQQPSLKDFYDKNDMFTVSPKDKDVFKKFLESLSDEDRITYDRALKENKNYYIVKFSNLGGLVMPIILELEYADGSSEVQRYPAEIWRRSPSTVHKLIVSDKEIKKFTLDPYWETADGDIYNNNFPREMIESRISMFKSNSSGRDGFTNRDLMYDMMFEEIKKIKEKKDKK